MSVDPHADTLPPAPACGPLELEAWLDDPPRLVLEPSYLDAIRALPLRGVAVMLDTTKAGLDSRWTAADLERLRRALPRHRLTLTAWGESRKAWIDELAAELPALLAAAEAVAAEVDDELRRSASQGASEGLADVLCGLGVDVEVTTYPALVRSRAAPLVRAIAARFPADRTLRLALQAYAVRERSTGLVDWDGALGPERHPAEAITRARRECPGVEIVAGLAAYDQRWPGHDPGDAMRASVASAAGTGVQRVRWWSLKHIVRLAARDYAAPAIESLRAIAITT